VDETVTLYRPTGPRELALVKQANFKRWPARLDWQPIFYPVLNREYAIQIARDWNAKDPQTGYRGFVTRFRVRASFLQRYTVHRVGARMHEEYWIPAEDLDALNDNIVGEIEVIDEFAGDGQPHSNS
jgi:hypothetical protein